MSVLEVMTEDAVLRSVAESFRVLGALRMELAYLGEMLDKAGIPRYSATDEHGKAGPYSLAHRLGLLVAQEQRRCDEAGAYKVELNRAKGAMDRFDANVGAPLDQRILAWEDVLRKDATKAPAAMAELAEIHDLLNRKGVERGASVDADGKSELFDARSRVEILLEAWKDANKACKDERSQRLRAEAALRDVKVSCTLPCTACASMREELATEKRLRLTAEDQARAARRMVFDMGQELERFKFNLANPGVLEKP